jgi:hypothetical protein
MRFDFPHFPAEFEIPDDWWMEAGMRDFACQSVAYKSTTEDPADLVALDVVEPPFRTVPLDWRGFDHARMVSILTGFVGGTTIQPIDLLILPALNDISRRPFEYRVLHGFHRFYASTAAGFQFLPATKRDVCS